MSLDILTSGSDSIWKWSLWLTVAYFTFSFCWSMCINCSNKLNRAEHKTLWEAIKGNFTAGCFSSQRTTQTYLTNDISFTIFFNLGLFWAKLALLFFCDHLQAKSQATLPAALSVENRMQAQIVLLMPVRHGRLINGNKHSMIDHSAPVIQNSGFVQISVTHTHPTLTMLSTNIKSEGERQKKKQ